MNKERVCPGSGESVSVHAVTGMWARCRFCNRPLVVSSVNNVLPRHGHTPRNRDKVDGRKADLLKIGEEIANGGGYGAALQRARAEKEAQNATPLHQGETQ
jgi:hypothetical protein